MFFDVFPDYTQTEVALPDYEGFWNSAKRIPNPVTSGVRFGSDGKIYRATKDGSWQWTGLVWLADGVASDYYLKFDITSGSALATSATDLSQMNANLDFTITTAHVRKKTNLTFSICDDTLGASILVTNIYQLDAERTVEIEQGEQDTRFILISEE